ncbi:MAG: transglutaminase [Alcaligenaceae bacterium]|nr:transglutaminase [Alcaligenaceae bacterium]
MQLRSVNTFWNTTVREAEDSTLWRQEDYWATPLESLGRQAGDCEDFVIGKYFSLLYLGVPADKLRFIYVSATLNGPSGRKTIAHMVLGYYSKPDADPLVLDNLNTEILPGSKRRDLKPVFSFNAQGIYVPGKANASADRLGRWSTLLTRMREQGLPV